MVGKITTEKYRIAQNFTVPFKFAYKLKLIKSG